jgi:hypothetical protein
MDFSASMMQPVKIYNVLNKEVSQLLTSMAKLEPNVSVPATRITQAICANILILVQMMKISSEI